MRDVRGKLKYGYTKGDKVRWTSQSLGHTTTKTGIISAVVPAGTWADGLGYIPNGGAVGNPRKHRSYVVKVGKRTYWPRVSQLSLVN